MLQGLYGQAVFVQPASRIVMVHTAVGSAPPSVNPDPTAYRERGALWYGVLRSLGGKTDR